ncbi:MAG: hypothetical protein DWP97_04580 [Calditrichaeota bacterium]|nr:MAG: hypothetical protein DWP97_04580 [Calditrichota bacterium]
MGPGNTESFSVNLLSSVEILEGLPVFEVKDTLSTHFIVDSIWINNPDESFKAVLYPYDTIYSYKQNYRMLLLSQFKGTENTLKKRLLYVHDTISVLHVFIPCSADIEGTIIYDTLYSEMHRVVEKNRFVVP